MSYFNLTPKETHIIFIYFTVSYIIFVIVTTLSHPSIYGQLLFRQESKKLGVVTVDKAQAH